MKLPFGSPPSSTPRRPRFLVDVSTAAAAGTQADGIAEKLAALRAQPLPAAQVAANEAFPASHPPAPPPPLQSAAQELQRDHAEALAAAIARIELRSARLAEEARADVLELAFALARKILETELHASHDALFAVVRAAIRRVGEARRIEVRLHPKDAQVLQAAMGDGRAQLVTLTPIVVVADAQLQPGDCVVDSDVGMIDGRLAERLAELRRSVDAAAEESAA